MSNGIDLAELTIGAALALQESGEVSAVDLARAHLGRIDALNPKTNAVLETNPDAHAIAQQLDLTRQRSGLTGPLHGIPILLKDNIDTGDSQMTSAGSLALAQSRAPKDAFLVERLRAAGAVILGKTNLSEWANFRSTRSSTGWSSRGGQTKNPYALDRCPGGSSSGSGVAVACAMAIAAVGTETDGSVVIPSAMNSLVGIKPTLGRVSRTGVIPIAHSQDTAGPIARNVTDALALFQAMLGVDTTDPITSESHANNVLDVQLEASALNGARIGVARTHCGYHEGVDALVDDAVEQMKECGATIIDDVSLITSAELREHSAIVLAYEFKADLAAYFRTRRPNAPIASVDDLIAFNCANAQRTMPYFGQELLEKAANTSDLTHPEYLLARTEAKRLAGKDGIDAALKANRLDALFAPTIGPPWPIDVVCGDHRSPGSSSPAAVAGYPSITAPIGYLHGLPVGGSWFASAFEEAKLARFVFAFEQAANLRVPPQLEPASPRI